jgi:predicted secreted protein
MESTLLKKNKITGLFIACYEIGGDKLGAPLFKVNLTVHTPTETINGLGQITQAIHPPLDVATKLDGNYTYMTVMPHNVHILVTATGYPIIQSSPQGGISPVISPNVNLRMVLSEDWKLGTANYKYIDNNGNWHTVENAPVKFVADHALPDTDRGGILLTEKFVNQLKIHGELAWFFREQNPSTGYSWRFSPDNSGVYELANEIVLRPSTPSVGVPGMSIWKFKAIREGKGSILFELYPPGRQEPVETVALNIEVTQ